MKRRNVCYLPHLIAWENLKKEDFTLTSLSQVLSETHKGLKHVILICLLCLKLVNIHFHTYISTIFQMWRKDNCPIKLCKQRGIILLHLATFPKKKELKQQQRRHLKIEFALLHVYRAYSISLSNNSKFFWIWILKTLSKFRQRKPKSLSCVFTFYKTWN